MKEYDFTERHMGTDVSISLVFDESAQVKLIANELFEIISTYEKRFSRFLPDSELSILNRTGHEKVSDVFLEVTTRSLELARKTTSAFNPLVQISQLGYQDNFTDLPTICRVQPNEYNTNLSELKIDTESKTITLAEGQQLDFGGFLKGYLATKLVDYIKQKYPECHGVIINIGGDISTSGHDELHEPFIFLLYNPVSGDEVPVILTDTALATSGTYARQWQTSQGIRHHIVDSNTRDNPACDLVAVSIVHNEGAFAEAMTKLFLTRGVDEAIKIVPPENNHYKYFCVTTDGKILSTIV
ncbi:FAD:protein FMN transferase [Candidatus Nomurabacteria bacterium]|nr:FAD:protein FMN transferase [Candidatus Kaiserbacteria bacterium]MCB9811063.1 FAD:protein FMN transferase [Candidatus Nomurabacteria bacterium]MCB9814923.1 FAD:protein FMN transferase [Candidatus Nomurabacteria bacterium]